MHIDNLYVLCFEKCVYSIPKFQVLTICLDYCVDFKTSSTHLISIADTPLA